MKNKIVRLMLKTVFALPLFVFGLWLVQSLYFPDLRDGKSGQTPEIVDEGDLFFRKAQQDALPVPRGHFHLVDEYIFQSAPFEPVCRSCHGTYAHSKKEKVRSLLNSHEGFLACAVCHVRKEPADKAFSFAWVDRLTGETAMAVAGEYGKFPAIIFPKKTGARGKAQIVQPISEESAKAFLARREKLTPDEVARARAKLHENISKEPVRCIECHKSGGYLAFAELGFAKNRVDHLTSLEVASMIDKYETFYLPEVIDLR